MSGVDVQWERAKAVPAAQRPDVRPVCRLWDDTLDTLAATPWRYIAQLRRDGLDNRCKRSLLEVTTPEGMPSIDVEP